MGNSIRWVGLAAAVFLAFSCAACKPRGPGESASPSGTAAATGEGEKTPTEGEGSAMETASDTVTGGRSGAATGGTRDSTVPPGTTPPAEKNAYTVTVVGKSPDNVVNYLKGMGYPVSVMDAGDLKDRDKLNRETTRCLVLCSDVVVKSAAVTNIRLYMKSFGDVIFLGKSGWNSGHEVLDLPLYFYYDTYQMWDLEGTAKILPAEGQTTATSAAAYTGKAAGWSALGYMYPGASEGYPILDAYDAKGRLLGRAATVLSNYGGEFAGSQWGLFGISTEEYYRSDAFLTVLLSMVDNMRVKAYFNSASALYKQRQELTATYSVAEKQPAGFVKIRDGRFVKPDGSPLFLLGTNYTAPICYMSGYGAGTSVNIHAIEADFKKAREAGLNFFRIWSVFADNPVACTAVRNLARKYGIYLEIVLPSPTGYNDSATYFRVLKENADYWKNETMVIGYDLENEPWITTVGGMTFDGKTSPAVNFKAYSSSSLLSGSDKAWCDKAVSENLWPSCPSFLSASVKKELWGVKVLFDTAVRKAYWGGNDEQYSTFPGYTGGPFAVADAYKDAYAAINQTFKLWIDGAVGAIKSADKNHYVTVGYNSHYALMDCNEALDFTNVHVYDPPKSRKNIENNITTLDRMAARFPSQPSMAGEFGVSCGYRMTDGSYIDPYTVAVADMCMYLYSYTKGYAGLAGWCLNETPVSGMLKGQPWLAAYSQADQIAQERIGLYTYDSTYGGLAKPLAKALAAFSQYASGREAGKGMSFRLLDGGTKMGTGYEFLGPDAVFAGTTSYSSDTLSFTSSKAACVFLFKAGGKLTVMSTASCTATINVKPFGLNAAAVKVTGSRGAVKTQGDKLVIDLYEGETLTIQ